MNPLQKYMFLQMQSGQQMNPALVAHLAKGGQPSGAPKELHRGGGQVMMPDMPFMQGHPALATPAMNDFMQGQGISPEGSSLEGGMPPEGEMGMPGGEYMDGASKAQAMAMNVPEQSQGPLEEGANRGREAAMQSLAMNDQQKQQSMGHAIMAMMSNMAKSQNPTMLGSLNESFGPASEAYQRAQAGHEAMNQKHYEMQRESERHREKMDWEKHQFNNQSAHQKASTEAAKKYRASGLTGDYVKLEQIGEQYGFDSEPYQQSKRALDAKTEMLEARVERSAVLNAPANQLSTDGKKEYEAQLRGLGASAEQIGEAIKGGKSVSDVAKDLGLNEEDIEKFKPEYAATGKNISDAKGRVGLQAEINAMEPLVTEWIKPYARRFAGYSPAQISDALRGENVDQQAKYIAAIALGPEIASVRVRMSGGATTQEIINQMVSKAQADGAIPKFLIGSEAFEKAQHYMNEALNKGVNAYEKSILGGGRKKGGAEGDNAGDPLGLGI